LKSYQHLENESLQNKYLIKGKRPAARDGHSACLVETSDSN